MLHGNGNLKANGRDAENTLTKTLLLNAKCNFRENAMRINGRECNGIIRIQGEESQSFKEKYLGSQLGEKYFH